MQKISPNHDPNLLEFLNRNTWIVRNGENSRQGSHARSGGKGSPHDHRVLVMGPMHGWKSTSICSNDATRLVY